MQKNKTFLDKKLFDIVVYVSLSTLVMLISTTFFMDIQVHLQCEKSVSGEIYCQLTTTKLLKQQKQILIPGELKSARLKIDSYEEGISYKIMLETPKGKIQFGMSSSQKAGKKKIVNQINNFINKSNINLLDIKQNNTRIYLAQLIFSGLILILCIFFIFLQILSILRPWLKSMINNPSKKHSISIR